MSDQYIPLSCIQTGKRAVVKTLCLNSHNRRRLLDLGFISNTEILVLQKSPLGDPIAYQIRGAVIALRSEDACQILVEVLENSSCLANPNIKEEF